MEYIQKEKELSRNILLEYSENPFCRIQLDMGTAFVPRQAVACQEYRVLYCQSNSGAQMTVGGRNYQLRRGDILVIRPGSTCTLLTYGRADLPYIGYVVTMEKDRKESLQRLVRQMGWSHEMPEGVIHTWGTAWDRLDTLFLMAMEEQQNRSPGWEVAMLGHVLSLMIQIFRAAYGKVSTVTGIEKQELLNAILSYVEAHLSEKITLESVASHFFVSTSTVTHLFNKKMGISFYRYVMQRRLWTARNLIREGIPMEKIAVQVGFGEYSSFYRAFRQEFHMSPRQYLKESREM